MTSGSNAKNEQMTGKDPITCSQPVSILTGLLTNIASHSDVKLWLFKSKMNKESRSPHLDMLVALQIRRMDSHAFMVTGTYRLFLNTA